MKNANSARCLCDQIYGVTAAHCDSTTAYLCDCHKNLTNPTRFRIGSKQVDFESSIEFAADMLCTAKAPIINGLESLGIKNQQMCVDLARATNSQIAYGSKDCGTIWRQGSITATLGELIEKSELVICICLLYTSPSPRDRQKSRMPSSA